MVKLSTGVCLLSNFLWKLCLIFDLSKIDFVWHPTDSNRLIFFSNACHVHIALYKMYIYIFDLIFFDTTGRRNQFNVSFARLFSIKTFSIRWFDTLKDFSPEKLIRQIIPDNFFRKPNGPPHLQMRVLSSAYTACEQ